MDGGQLYYKFNGTKDQWYKILLTSTFSNAHAVIFTTATCAEADIQADCQSGGATGDFSEDVDAGMTRAAYFKAPATGTIHVAVDSEGTNGAFTLSIEELAAVGNGTCATATPLTFFNGKATLRGDLGPQITPNEYGTDIDCGGFSAYDEAQAYYKFTATTNKAYKITVKSDSAAWLYSYVFRAASCGTSASINTDCGSAGASGAVTSTYADNGDSITYIFAPTTAGDYVIGVDTKYPEDYGGFTLTVEDFTPPTNGTCAAATALTLTAGKVTVNGTTLGLKDEYATLDCGGFSYLDGPQAYYELAPAAGKFYKVTLAPQFSGYAYWFPKASCGTLATINSNCGSAGLSGGKLGSVSSGSTGSMVIGGQSAPVLIGVDSTDVGTLGDFALTIEEVVPPTNNTCATATALTLVAGKVSLTGDTALATPTLDLTSSGCTTYSTEGNDVFYSVAVTAGTTYLVKLDASWDAAVYVLDGCTGTPPTCLAGMDGGTKGIESLILKPTTTGTVIIGVDASSTSDFGSFTLSVEEAVAPANDTCATATAITLTGGKGSITGDTTLAVDDLSLPYSGCTGGTTPGREVFYTIPVTANVAYTVQVDASFDGVLYVLDGCASPPSCLAGADDGTSGIESVTFTPTTTGTAIVVVDGYSSGDFGAFTVTVNP